MDESVDDIFPGRAAFDANAGDAFFELVPAKACVALFIDASGGALQLVCTKNLRAMLRRRLENPDAEEAALPGKRIDYRALLSAVAWRRVDSDFEMDLIYIEATRRAFPSHWRRLIPDRSAYFVAIDTSHPHPDFVRTSDSAHSDQTAIFGPFPDRAKADRWIELARDAFDLCRYRAILAQAPNGRACSYKQMNKCPAPCDGTVTLDSYRQGVSSAVTSIRFPAALVAELGERMKTHAGQLEFEQAGRVKSRLAIVSQLSDGHYKGVRPIDAFRFITVQPGPKRGTAKVFMITDHFIVEAIDIADPKTATLRDTLSALDAVQPPSLWPPEVLLGLASFHLAGSKSGHRFIARQDLTSEKFDALVADACKPRAAKEESGEPIRETRLET